MRLFTIAVFMLAGAAGAAPMLDGDVTVAQADDSLVTVTYGIKGESAIVTVDIQTNGPAGYASIDQAFLTNVYGDVNVKVPVGKEKKIYWNPAATVTGRLKAPAARAVVTLHATNSPPDYAVVDISSGTQAGSASFKFYPNAEQIPFGVTNVRYKTTHCILRRIRAAGVLWPMGEGGTRHFVALPDDYYLGIYELTQGQLRKAVASLSLSVLDRTMDNADLCPAAGAITYTNIRGGNNWPEASDHSFVNSWAYLQYVRNKVGGLFKLDLPTEAQWEYAARAGEYAAEYAHGAEVFDGFGAYAWCSSNVAESATLQEVGTRLPNRWGLYDMFGNASEWCLDNYRADYGMSLPEYDDVNFAGPATDSIPNGGNIPNPDVADKVVRGGSYKDGADGMKCSYRKHTYRGTTDSGKDIGFRLCAPAVYPY